MRTFGLLQNVQMASAPLCCFLCIFVVLIDKVCLQVTVEGVIGGSVVLPCSSAKHDLKPEGINVHWRQNDGIHVYDITERKDSVANQHQRYKNRIETFPEEYVRRNFSIKLTGLTHTDAGKYICFITPSNEQETVLLIIKVLDLHQYYRPSQSDGGQPAIPTGIQKDQGHGHLILCGRTSTSSLLREPPP
ncbi:CD276 antigen-like protein [Labeo rohita]|uniref:CD276 antigen-like protein n=1 Tax=Labeo rohita TaxID=84645 RepID=A0A498L1M1_LABRO|nr:CD276 antigen-like protein [Labeo rohita]